MNGLNIENNNFKEKMDDREELYGKFVYLYNQFLSVESVEETYNKKRLDLEKLLEDLERDDKNLITIRRELDELATDEALKKSSLLIDEGRKELAYLAEEYAINKAAAFILKKVRKTFIQQTRDKLLAGASKYFREITRGEYKAVLPPENILEGDFQAVLRDGTI